jgi:antitoxin VapB
MGKEYTAKTFKSGNSVALRLPKGLGVNPGEVAKIIQDEDGDFAVKLTERPKRKFNIDKVWGIGKHLDLKFIEPEDRIFEHRPLLWENAEWLASVRDRKP